MSASCLIYLCVTVATLLTTSQVMTQSYDAAQLSKCALLGQQLRNDFRNRTTTFFLRAMATTNLTNQVTQALNADMNSANSVLSQTWNALYQAASILGKKYALALKLLRDQNYVPTMTQFSLVEFDHSLGYSTASATLRFRKAGIYLIEFKAQSQYYGHSYTTIKIFSSVGTVKYNYYLFTDWEVTPYFLMANITTSDYMVLYSSSTYRILNGVNSTFSITLLQG